MSATHAHLMPRPRALPMLRLDVARPRAMPDSDEPARGHPAVHEIHCRTLLNRVRPPMPFRWSANPYRGCMHACFYCYARPSHITFDLDGGTEFERHIFVKVNAIEVFRAELRRPGWHHE